MKEIRKQKKKKKKRRKIEKGLGASLSAQEGSQPAAHLGILNRYAFFLPPSLMCGSHLLGPHHLLLPPVKFMPVTESKDTTILRHQYAQSLAPIDSHLRLFNPLPLLANSPLHHREISPPGRRNSSSESASAATVPSSIRPPQPVAPPLYGISHPISNLRILLTPLFIIFCSDSLTVTPPEAPAARAASSHAVPHARTRSTLPSPPSGSPRRATPRPHLRHKRSSEISKASVTLVHKNSQCFTMHVVFLFF
jgi:hypothetical protein